MHRRLIYEIRRCAGGPAVFMTTVNKKSEIEPKIEEYKKLFPRENFYSAPVLIDESGAYVPLPRAKAAKALTRAAGAGR
jgi:hypothetical protein